MNQKSEDLVDVVDFGEIDEVDESISAEDQESFDDLVGQIKERCDANEISYSSSEDIFFQGYENAIYVNLPSKRESRRVYIENLEDAQKLVAQKFEGFGFIEDFFAIYSPQQGVIAARVKELNKEDFFHGRGTILNRIKRSKGEKPKKAQLELTGDGKSKGKSIILRKVFPFTELLTRVSQDGPFEIKISGVDIEGHDEAQQILESVSDALFFQIETETGEALGLVRRARRPKRFRGRQIEDSFSFPTIHYDHEPMSLYWYGVGATQTPLMQFLAFYQAIENYFPSFAQAEAQKKVRNIIKRPNFQVDRDDDVIRIIAAAQSAGKTAIGGERSQLKATIANCVGKDEIDSFISASPARKEFLENNKKLSKRRINLKAVDDEVINQVAERVYEIRCRIVHAKSGDDYLGPILPFTSEEDSLRHDIELIRMLAARVIAAGGRPLKI